MINSFFYSVALLLVYLLASPYAHGQTYIEVSDPSCAIPTAANPYDYTISLNISNIVIGTSSCNGWGYQWAVTFDAEVVLSGSHIPPSNQVSATVSYLIIDGGGTVVGSGTAGSALAGIQSFSQTNYFSSDGSNTCPPDLSFQLDVNTSTWNGPCIQNAPLPIELAYFKAHSDKNIITVSWKTVSEINNDYFKLEKSSDGIGWQEMTVIPGHQTTLEPVHYIYEDLFPFPGNNYYRLIQVDSDSTSKISPLARAHFKSLHKMEVFPNPAKDYFYIKGELSDKTRIILLDINGKEKEIKPDYYQPGFIQFNLSDSKPGIYVLKVFEGFEQVMTHKLLISS